MPYHITEISQLSPQEIENILAQWNITEWQGMPPQAFREKFKKSEFHFLTNASNEILCRARINFDFTLEINGQRYAFAELVGLVSIIRGQGYGQELMHLLVQNMQQRGIEALGFCAAGLRPFYEKCGTEILYNQAKHLREEGDNGQWVAPADDDDILSLSLSPAHRQILQGLSATNTALLVF